MFVESEECLFSEKGSGVTQRMLGYVDNLMAVEMTFQKGSIVEPHCHKDHTQCIYIIQGKFELTCGDKKKIVQAGDCCYAEPNEMHGTSCLEDNSKLLDIHNPMRSDILDDSIEYNNKNK